MENTVKNGTFLKVSGIHPLYILALQVYGLLALLFWELEPAKGMSTSRANFRADYRPGTA